MVKQANIPVLDHGLLSRAFHLLIKIKTFQAKRKDVQSRRERE